MKPTPGTQYTTESGETLKSISNQAFGNPAKWPLISDVNQSQITLSQNDVIPTGTNLIIPIDTELSGLRQAQLARGLG